MKSLLLIFAVLTILCTANFAGAASSQTVNPLPQNWTCQISERPTDQVATVIASKSVAFALGGTTIKLSTPDGSITARGDLFFKNDEPLEPALRNHGYAMGSITVNGLRIIGPKVKNFGSSLVTVYLSEHHSIELSCDVVY